MVDMWQILHEVLIFAGVLGIGVLALCLLITLARRTKVIRSEEEEDYQNGL